MQVNNKLLILIISLISVSTGCKPLPISSDESPNGGTDKDYKLLSHYTFDSMDIVDVSGNECDGYAVGNVSYLDDTPSGSGKSLFINGIKGQYVNIPHNVFAGKVSYSLSFWIKDFGKGCLLSAISSDLVRCDFPRLYAGEANFTFYTRYDNYNDTPTFVYVFSSLLSSGWHHIVLTCENNGQSFGYNALRCLYVDGKLVDKNSDYSQAFVSMHGWDEDIITSFHIGGDRSGYYPIAPGMKIDNIRFYADAIPLSLVKDLYEGKK